MLPEGLRVLYLHGFASGPQSRKAGFFAGRLREAGFPVDIADLAEDGFERLTISGQLRVIERSARGQSVVLIGSSLGGYLAALYAASHPEVDRLVLLAPAFNFWHLWASELGPVRLAEWRKNGHISVFHYAEGREMPIGYQLMEDASRFEPFPGFRQPALIIHGDFDNVVPPSQSAEFAALHPNVRLVRVQSGHELTDVLEPIWQEIKSFLLTGNQRIGC